MNRDDLDIDKLEATARAAQAMAPGPYTVDWCDEGRSGIDGIRDANRQDVVCADCGVYPPCGSVAEHIAGTSPDVVLKLIAMARGVALEPAGPPLAVNLHRAIVDAIPVIEVAIAYAELHDGPPNGMTDAVQAFGGGGWEGIERASGRLDEMRQLAGLVGQLCADRHAEDALIAEQERTIGKMTEKIEHLNVVTDAAVHVAKVIGAALGEALDQWEDFACAAMPGRLVTRIAELRKLLGPRLSAEHEPRCPVFGRTGLDNRTILTECTCPAGDL